MSSICTKISPKKRNTIETETLKKSNNGQLCGGLVFERCTSEMQPTRLTCEMFWNIERNKCGRFFKYCQNGPNWVGINQSCIILFICDSVHWSPPDCALIKLPFIGFQKQFFSYSIRKNNKQVVLMRRNRFDETCLRRKFTCLDVSIES